MSYEIRINQRLNGQEVINIVHYDAFNADVLPDIVDLCTKIKDEWVIELSAQLSFEMSLIGFDYRVLPAAPGTPFVPVPVAGLPLVGQSADNSMAAQVALVLDKRSNTNAPWRGSLKIGGMAETNMGGGGFFSTNMLNAAQAYADGLRYVEITPGVAATMVIRSRGTATVPVGQEAPVATFTAVPNPGTLKSRKFGTGS